MASRFGFVAIIGRPNVGKSTLMNHLIGQKISITSRKPQTTRNRILGVDTQGEFQAAYVDTPGLHRQEPRAINHLMNRAAQSALSGVDAVIFVVDPFTWNDDDEMAFARVRQASEAGVPAVLCINKLDMLHKDKAEILPVIERLSGKMDFKAVVPVSALKAVNLDELRKVVFECLPEGSHLYSDDSVTDRSSRFLAAEIVREKLMRQMGDELPYSSTVEIDSFEEEEDLLRISATILVERQGQKKMVIGAGGSRIKKIGTEARIDMEKLFGQKVFLKLFVKVKAGWADDERALKSLGYTDFERR
ncbi:MAG: GTPase Era [Succinivibrio sp.]